MLKNRFANLKPSARLLFFLLIVMLAFGLRLHRILTQTVVIENDGAEYTRMAQNLVSGKGYIGLEGGPELNYAPLYPCLIAAVSLATGNFEIASRMVSLVMGSLLVLVVYFMALQIYGCRTALIGASLIAFHPLLIGYSAAAYNETVYLTCLAAAVYWALRALDCFEVKSCCLAGVFFGLSYLSRVESAALGFATALFFLLQSRSRRTLCVSLKASMELLAMFFIVALPYIAFLSSHTGHFRLEAKSKIQYTIGCRINAGMTVSQAQRGINDQLEEEGPMLNQNRYVDYTPYPFSVKDIFDYVVQSAKRNRYVLYQDFLPEPSFGSPVLLGFIVLGLFRKKWDSRRCKQELYLGMIVGLILFVLLSAHYIWFRYVLPLLPFSIVWASKGIEECAGWAAGSVTAWRGSVRMAWISRVVCLVAVTSLLAVSWLGFMAEKIPDLDGGTVRNLPAKLAGLWLKDRGAKRIMDSETRCAFYSGATLAPLPYAPSDLALRYISKKQPDFVVLTEMAFRTNPYLSDWLAKGIPDRRAQLVDETGDKEHRNRVLVYEWIEVGKQLSRDNAVHRQS